MAKPTVIKVSGQRGDFVPVVEDVEAVTSAFNGSHGPPFPVELATGGRVYINPPRVAYWYEATEAQDREGTDGPELPKRGALNRGLGRHGP